MSIKKEYRESDTGDLYIIRYEDHGNTWRAFAEDHPYNPYDESVVKCHLYPSSEVCVDRTKFNPQTLDQIKACVFLWMEGYSQYVRTGVFPATGGRVNV